MPSITIEEGRHRVVIESVSPEVDGGRFAAKRCVGDSVMVEADAFCDGHDRIACRLRWRRENETTWHDAAMTALANDRWRGHFIVTEPGAHRYTVLAWVDHFASWRNELPRRIDADDILSALHHGAELVRAAADRADDGDRTRLHDYAASLESSADAEAGRHIGLDPTLATLMFRHPDLSLATTYERELPLWVDRPRARCGAWYEMFPRSCVAAKSEHGNFASCIERLPYVVAMGFDVLYLPPIHPIGVTRRKEPNNTVPAEKSAVATRQAAAVGPGSPWAIGAAEGGHTAVHPQLGSLDDFRQLMTKASELGIELALDFAIQCSPDHPWVTAHPEWFRHRPDGSIQYAENPPKKYQDIYPIDFETTDWRALWTELKSVVDFWINEGIAIFRVDNPHTKAFPFWEWLIGEVHRDHPEVIFLAEAFTRPRVMQRLAKLGFSQSYTYFSWRNTRHELTEYFTELTRGDVREYLRPNLWPNTPDILTEYLQFGGRAGFVIRLVLAATLGASYGIYGPAFELQESAPRDPGGEEYLDSEKYQVRHWDIDRADSLKDVIARVNRIRRDNSALQQDWNLEFYPVDNEQIICYGKFTDDLADMVVVVVNLDPHHAQSGWVSLPVERFGLEDERPYQMHDELSGARYLWHGARNFVSLDPGISPAHIFRMRRRVRTEHDFDYFM
ncbi:MAG: alpha-1,4-glucan--maltose-1-phosphate maltosyltransferase [Gammaproteobacteria bacterium]|nr:alpha-1,4-glucan--maltose-1-phosphate maltosyltransferase [Gammaproteobacteria bacterium]MBU1414206.1 alpha-1,4-glucan--maltose-1-phosphate maltosyltransferase [Gammaproteobacteria bacterium]